MEQIPHEKWNEITYIDFIKYYHKIPDANFKGIIANMAQKANEVSPLMVGSNSPLITFISGGVAGLVSRTITAPVDWVKVLM